jgi:hypothetical protein
MPILCPLLSTCVVQRCDGLDASASCRHMVRTCSARPCLPIRRREPTSQRETSLKTCLFSLASMLSTRERSLRHGTQRLERPRRCTYTTNKRPAGGR